MAFKRLTDRFQMTGNTSPAKPEARSATPGKLIKSRSRKNGKAYPPPQPQSICKRQPQRLANIAREVALEVIETSHGRAFIGRSQDWPARVQRVAPPKARWLRGGHMNGREVVRAESNKQNERFWAVENPKVSGQLQGTRRTESHVLGCRGQWAGHPLARWIDRLAPGSTVTGQTYLRLLKEFWPQVRGEVGKQGLWFQQDGAAVHTTAAVRQWLDDKFDGRVIRRQRKSPKAPSLLEACARIAEDVERAVRHLRQWAEIRIRRRGHTVESP